jgi:hypothetical protein
MAVPGPIASRLLTAVVLLATLACGQPDTPPPPPHQIDGVEPRHTPEEIAEIALDRIAAAAANYGEVAPARILSLTATTAARVSHFEPGAVFERPSPDVIVWIVRAEGTFGTRRGPELAPSTGSSGFFLLSDEDGSVIGTGFPLTPREGG